MLKDFNFVKSKIVNSNEVFEYTMSDNMIENNYMDLLISPALTNNNALNSPANISQSEQVEAFEQVFDDAIDMLDFEIDNLTKNKPKAEILLLLIKTIIYLKSLNLCKINVMLLMLCYQC